MERGFDKLKNPSEKLQIDYFPAVRVCERVSVERLVCPEAMETVAS